MADLYNYYTLSGVIETDTSIIQAEVQTEFINAFGASLSLSTSTPQGLLIAEETLARSAVADNNVAIANQINPNLAGGVFLDALGALTGIQRTPNTYSLVIGNLTGINGSIIPQGSQARDVNGNLWQTITAVTFVGTTAIAVFQAVSPGPLILTIGQLNQIVTVVLGWSSVTNNAAQTFTGSVTQTDASFKTFRLNTLAAQGYGLPLAILSSLYLPPPQGAGVISATFLENLSPTTQVVKRNPSDAEGVTMVGHSIYVCAFGGTNTNIANVLTQKKDAGAAYSNGASMSPVTIDVTDPYSGQVIPVMFDNPDLIAIAVQVKISSNTTVQDPINVVTAAIIAYSTGKLPGEQGLVIGASVSAFEFAGAITFAAPGIFVLDVQIAVIPNSLGYATLPFYVWQLPTLTASDITVIVI